MISVFPTRHSRNQESEGGWLLSSRDGEPDRHRNQILGVLSCFDCLVILATLPSVCHANSMATVLDSRCIRLFH